MIYCPNYLMFGCWPRLPVNFYFPTLRSREAWMRHLNKTEVVPWLENRSNRIETWQSHPSQSRHLSREEEDQGQMGGQASWGSTADHDRHPLVWSERPWLGYETGVCSTMSSSSMLDCHLLWHGILLLNPWGTYATDIMVGFNSLISPIQNFTYMELDPTNETKAQGHT